MNTTASVCALFCIVDNYISDFTFREINKLAERAETKEVSFSENVIDENTTVFEVV